MLFGFFQRFEVLLMAAVDSGRSCFKPIPDFITQFFGYRTYSNSNDINNYNYIPSTWSADNGAYLRLKEIVLGYTLPKAWMNKSGFISNLRIYVSGADLWEKSYITDGWDPEATRKVENKQRYPFNRTVTFGVNATF